MIAIASMNAGPFSCPPRQPQYQSGLCKDFAGLYHAASVKSIARKHTNETSGEVRSRNCSFLCSSHNLIHFILANVAAVTHKIERTITLKRTSTPKARSLPPAVHPSCHHFRLSDKISTTITSVG